MHWINKSLSRKFVAGTAIGLIAVSIAFLVLFSRMYTKQLEHERSNAADYVNKIFQTSLEAAMLRRDLDSLRSIVQQLGKQEGIAAVAILNPQGEIRFASAPDMFGRHIDIECPECRQSIREHLPFTYFTVAASGTDILRSVNPVKNKPQCTGCHGPVDTQPLNGTLLVDYDATPIETNARNTTLALMGSGAVVVLITLLGGWWFMRRFVLKPVSQLAQTSRALAAGKLDARTSVTGSDELAELGTTINTMAGNLQQSLKAIRDKERFLQDVVDAVPDGIRIIDEEFNVILANTAYCEQLGMAKDACTGTPCYASTHKRDTPCPPTLITCPVHEIKLNPAPLKSVHRHTRSDASELNVEIYAAPLIVNTQDGQRSLVVESIRNLEETVQFSHEQKLSELGRLAAGVAHEIHNPLASIRLALDTLLRAEREEEIDKDSRLDYLQLVDSEIDRCISVTERLLKLSMFSGEQARPVDINTAVSDTLSLAAWEASSCSITVEASLTADNPRVMAGESDMRIVVLNLVQNALHAMPDGGRLHVKTQRCDGQVELIVEDSGVGMSDDDRQHIFDPFFSRRADGVRGTGLGLSITLAVVERYGGGIDVESTLGKGSTFTVRLPDVDSTQGEKQE